MTTIREIMVYMDRADATAKRLLAAAWVAELHQARLTAVNVQPPVTLPIYSDASLGLEALETQLESAAQAHSKQLGEQFEKVLTDYPIDAHWTTLQGDLLDALLQEARYTDLIIGGQGGDDDSDMLTPNDLADQLILLSGCPVLVVPYIGAAETIGKRILIAWNGKREGVRAVHEAMPFLRCASLVEVVAVETDGGLPICQRLCEYLQRHDVVARPHCFPAGGVSIAERLLARAADESMDLIVSGAYGHSRFRELLLGGMTNSLLQEMTVPVLMSH